MTESGLKSACQLDRTGYRLQRKTHGSCPWDIASVPRCSESGTQVSQAIAARSRRSEWRVAILRLLPATRAGAWRTRCTVSFYLLYCRMKQLKDTHLTPRISASSLGCMSKPPHGARLGYEHLISRQVACSGVMPSVLYCQLSTLGLCKVLASSRRCAKRDKERAGPGGGSIP